MAEHSRTILEEYVKEGEHTPLDGGYYGICRMRLIAMGGWQSDIISAKLIDDHYLIVRKECAYNPNNRVTPLAIVDMNDPSATQRLYQEAVKIARERARNDKNKVIDITSHTKNIPRDAFYYISIDMMVKRARLFERIGV